MATRTVTTENSIWIFDLEDKAYFRRHRKDEIPGEIPYTGDWEPYDYLVEPDEHAYGSNRLLVMRPVPMGTGRMRLTGYIETDVTEN